jgi:MFS family permease
MSAKSEPADERRRSADFRRLWAALTVALFGAQIAALALPLTAAVSLDASPLQMGFLAAAGLAPFLLCSLPMGVWVDRAARRRPLLVAADLGRSALLGIVPLAALLDLLTVELLSLVAFLAGILSVLFDIAHYSYIPTLVGRERLTDANGKIQVSYSSADAAGPGLAGILIQIASAPFAVVATALSFLTSALLLGSIAQPEPPRPANGARSGFRQELAEGMRALLGHPLLRPIIRASVTAGLFMEAVRAVYVLFAARDLGLGATRIGIVLAIGGATAVPGGLLAGWTARRIGFGRAIIGGWFLECASLLLIPLASGPSAIAVLAFAQALGGFAGAVANVNQWSLRQIVTPDHLQARVTASHRCTVYGAQAIGALVGGVLASAFGLRPAILVCAVASVLGLLWLVASPVLGLREVPVWNAERREEAEGASRVGFEGRPIPATD